MLVMVFDGADSIKFPSGDVVVLAVARKYQVPGKTVTAISLFVHGKIAVFFHGEAIRPSDVLL